VQPGDSLARIAWMLHQQGKPVSVRTLADANPGVEWRRLKVGETITIPLPDKAQPEGEQ
jgi:phage tail protein X